MDSSNSWWAIGDYLAWLKARYKHTRSSYVTHIHWTPKCTKLLKNVSTQWSWKGRKPQEGWETHIIYLPVFLLYHLLLMCLYGICAHVCETLSLRFHVPWLNLLVSAIPIFDPSGWAIWAPQLKVWNKCLVDRMLIELRNENKQWQIALRELSEGACLCRGLGPSVSWTPLVTTNRLSSAEPTGQVLDWVVCRSLCNPQGSTLAIVSYMPDHVLDAATMWNDLRTPWIHY